MKDAWKSTTTVNGEQSVMTPSTMSMHQLLVFNWDLGKIDITDVRFPEFSVNFCD